jgi:hypothetical protein
LLLSVVRGRGILLLLGGMAIGALATEPQSVNSAPYQAGWLMRIRPTDPAALATLMAAADYDNGPGA